MGGKYSRTTHQKNVYIHSSFDKLDCDDKGTMPCKENTIRCMNGGVCGLYVADLEDECIERCNCPPEYFGDSCEFHSGFYSANIGLIIGLFLAFLFLIFGIVLIWYCCNRHKRKTERGPTINRIISEARNNQSYRRGQLKKTQEIPEGVEQAGTNLTSPHMREFSTSQSFSIYENVGYNEPNEATNFPPYTLTNNDYHDNALHISYYDGIESNAMQNRLQQHMYNGDNNNNEAVSDFNLRMTANDLRIGTNINQQQPVIYRNHDRPYYIRS